MYFSPQLIWSSATANIRVNYDGAIELREIREIRPGKNSKEFEKWAEECKRVENKICFTVFHGKLFKLKSLAVVGKCAQYQIVLF